MPVMPAAVIGKPYLAGTVTVYTEKLPIPVKECLDEAYLNGPTVHNPSGQIPNDPEIPLLLNRVFPAHEVVKIDYHLPGCPPPADTLWEALVALLTDKPVELPYELIKYD